MPVLVEKRRSTRVPEFLSADVIIVGAGFSYAATGGSTPLMQGYFDNLSATKFPNLTNFISECGLSRQNANVEDLLLILQQACSSPPEVLRGWADAWPKRKAAICRELGTYTVSRLKGKCIAQGENFAAAVLSAASSDTTVISMNYDNIAEMVLANRVGMTHLSPCDPSPTCPHCRMRRLLEMACNCNLHQLIDDPSDWRGAVLKLHGSIAWKRCLNSECCKFECMVAHPRCRPFDDHRCSDCCQNCGPVMVMPSMAKMLSEIREIGTMWHCAQAAIADAKTMLIYGFSLPKSDILLQQMMRTSIAAGNRLESVTVVDPNHKDIVPRVRDLLPKSRQIAIHTFEPLPFPRAESKS